MVWCGSVDICSVESHEFRVTQCHGSSKVFLRYGLGDTFRNPYSLY